tara:strand:+ start:1377 stop:2153 length:777 start_codon:yes stop_codon:yes gene_type:complete
MIDSHCHLDFEELNKDLETILNNAKKQNVLGMQTICTKINEFDKVVTLSSRYNNIWCSIGTHPHNAEEENHISAEKIIKLCENKKVIGIGETGLDYYYKNSKKNIQIESFLKHIYVSQKTNIPIIIHAREADKDIINILNSEYKKEPFKGVIHCFTSSYELAKSVLNLGFYISFSGIITFNNANDIRESCKKIPIQSILIETDAPYLAPVPYRGKRNEPSYVTETLNKISEIKNINKNEVDQITTDNFFNLFKKASLL